MYGILSPGLLAQESYWVFIAGNVDQTETGIGIYTWNSSAGELVEQYRDSTIKQASYLAINERKGLLYAVNGEGIYSFLIHQDNGKLKWLGKVEHAGTGACHVSLSYDGNILLVAYYGSGSLASYRIRPNGAVGNSVTHIRHNGSSINKKRQKSPHVHQVVAAPNSRLIYVNDLGTDEIKSYRLFEDGGIEAQPVSNTKLFAGSGPRHLAFHPFKPWVYVLAELTGQVFAFTYDKQNGILDQIDSCPTLPTDFQGFNKSADIHISSDGQYLYASHRGANTLAVGLIDLKEGKISRFENLDCGGDWPRAFEMDPSGHYILVANKRSDSLSVMTRDIYTGTFQKAYDLPTVRGPQCIKLLKR